jgi:PmbA protein
MRNIDAEALVKLALRECEHVEVFAESGRSIEVSAESGVFSDISEEEGFGFGVRVIRNGRAGFSFGNDLGKFSAVVSKACAVSKIGPKLSGLPEPGKYGKVSGAFDRRIADLDGRELLSRLDGMEKLKCRPTYAGASCSVNAFVIANSNGVHGEFSSTEIEGGAYASAGESTGFEGRSSRRDNLDIPAFGRIAAERALASRNPEKIEGMKKARILLHPYAVEGLLDNTFLPSIDGENVFRKNSKLTGKIGRRLFSPDLTIIDDGLLKGGNNSFPFDCEGTPCRKTPIVSRGILKSFLYNWETGLRAGKKSTGNGFRGAVSPPHISPTNLVISPGRTRKSEIDCDFSVLWLSGTHTTNQFSGDFSVEMKNALRTSTGKPVKKGLISGNIFDVLGSASPAKDGVEKLGGLVTPPVVIEADVVA